MPRYKSKQFKELFITFQGMFKEEGDVYQSIKDSVENDYDHSSIPSDISKKVVLTVLKDAAVDYYKSQIEVKPEKQLVEEWVN